jgi:hypothetical protein
MRTLPTQHYLALNFKVVETLEEQAPRGLINIAQLVPDFFLGSGGYL